MRSIYYIQIVILQYCLLSFTPPFGYDDFLQFQFGKSLWDTLIIWIYCVLFKGIRSHSRSLSDASLLRETLDGLLLLRLCPDICPKLEELVRWLFKSVVFCSSDDRPRTRTCPSDTWTTKVFRLLSMFPTSEDVDPLNVWFFVLKLVSWFFADFEEDSDLLLLTLLEGLVNK